MTDRTILATAWLSLLALGITWWAVTSLGSLLFVLAIVTGIGFTVWAMAVLLDHFDD